MKILRQLLSLGLRLGLAAAVMVYLFRKMGVANLGNSLRAVAGQWPWLLAAGLLALPPLLLCMARWKTILDAQGMRLPWIKVTAIFFIGLFFNSFMIGPTGGDVIKAFYTTRETHHKKTEAVATIFIDRIIGLLTLALIVLVLVLARWDFFMAHPVSRAFAIPALAACAILLGGGALAFGIHLFEAFPWLKRWNHVKGVATVVNTAERAYNAFFICRRHPRLLLTLLLQSLALQLLFVGVAWCIGRALSLDAPFLAYLTFVPLIGVISGIPVTPGGLGLREGASVHLWGLLGVVAEKAFLLGFLPYLILVCWGIPGGILFLFHKAGTPPPGAEDAG
jgi:uncharacterized protein (TIRG00374 family)